jgi:hypothetical protein
VKEVQSMLDPHRRFVEGNGQKVSLSPTKESHASNLSEKRTENESKG